MSTRGDLFIIETRSIYTPKHLYKEVHCTITHDAYVEGFSSVFAEAYEMYKNKITTHIPLLNCLIAVAPEMFEINEDRQGGHRWRINMDSNTIVYSYDGDDLKTWTAKSLAEHWNYLLKLRDIEQKSIFKTKRNKNDK